MLLALESGMFADRVESYKWRIQIRHTRTVSKDTAKAWTWASHRSSNILSRLSKLPEEPELCPKWVLVEWCEWHEGELEESDMLENGKEAEDGEDGNKDSNISALTGASKLRRLSRNWIAMRILQAHFR
jgi:hypothetical protein